MSAVTTSVGFVPTRTNGCNSVEPAYMYGASLVYRQHLLWQYFLEGII
jgi:hypothetical protein